MFVFLIACFVFYLLTKEREPKYDPTLQKRVNELLEKLDREEKQKQEKFYLINGRLYSEQEKNLYLQQIKEETERIEAYQKQLLLDKDKIVDSIMDKATKELETGIISEIEFNEIINSCLDYKAKTEL